MTAAGRHKPGERLTPCRHRLAAIGAAQKMRASRMMGGDLVARNVDVAATKMRPILRLAVLRRIDDVGAESAAIG